MHFLSEQYINYFPLANIFIHAFCNLSISMLPMKFPKQLQVQQHDL